MSKHTIVIEPDENGNFTKTTFINGLLSDNQQKQSENTESSSGNFWSFFGFGGWRKSHNDNGREYNEATGKSEYSRVADYTMENGVHNSFAARCVVVSAGNGTTYGADTACDSGCYDREWIRPTMLVVGGLYMLKIIGYITADEISAMWKKRMNWETIASFSGYSIRNFHIYKKRLGLSDNRYNREKRTIRKKPVFEELTRKAKQLGFSSLANYIYDRRKKTTHAERHEQRDRNKRRKFQPVHARSSKEFASS